MMRTKPARPSSPDDDYKWFREGSVPHSREDRIAEALALIALVFSLGIGLVIALLPVSADAATRAAATAPDEAGAAQPGHPRQPVYATRALATIACDSDA